MQQTLVVPEDVHLVHRVAIDKRTEIHAYVQEYGGATKAHVRLVNIRKNGTVS